MSFLLAFLSFLKHAVFFTIICNFVRLFVRDSGRARGILDAWFADKLGLAWRGYRPELLTS